MDVHSVFGGDISEEDYDRWLAQFPAVDRPFAEKLATAFRYYSLRRMNGALKRLYSLVLDQCRVPEDRLRFIPVGYVAKSGSMIAYAFRKQNKLKEDRFISSNHLGLFEYEPSLVPVLIDDFIGTGHQSMQVIDEFRAAAPSYRGQVVFAAGVGMEVGLRLLGQREGVVAIAADVVSSGHLPFAESSTVFPDPAERRAALEMVTRYGMRLYPQHPLGYERSQSLIGFFYSTPNNTLPIFWSSEDGWSPLLPYGESFRDPSYLFGPPTGLPEQLARRGPSKPLLESTELEKYDVPEDVAVRIFGEFHKPAIFLVLAPIIKALGISPSAFNSLLSAVSKLRHLEHEQHPVRCSLMLVASNKELRTFGTPVVEAESNITLGNVEELSSLSQFVDGLRGAVIARADGEVAGTVLFRAIDHNVDQFLPKRYTDVAAASKAAEALCFLFIGGGRVHVFYDGDKILTHRNAAWHLQPGNFSGGLAALERDHALGRGVLENVMRIALALADEGRGALLTVGDHARVLEFSDPPKVPHMRFAPVPLGQGPDEMVTGLLTQDGASIISAEGVLMQAMTFLRPPAGTAAEEEVGRGSKHSTAAKISRVTNALAIAVSVDGRISLYARGEKKLKVMA